MGMVDQMPIGRDLHAVVHTAHIAGHHNVLIAHIDFKDCVPGIGIFVDSVFHDALQLLQRLRGICHGPTSLRHTSTISFILYPNCLYLANQKSAGHALRFCCISIGYQISAALLSVPPPGRCFPT